MLNRFAIAKRLREVFAPARERQFLFASRLLNDPRLDDWIAQGVGYVHILKCEPFDIHSDKNAVERSLKAIKEIIAELGASACVVLAANDSLPIATPQEAEERHNRLKVSRVGLTVELYLQHETQGWRSFAQTWGAYLELLDIPESSAHSDVNRVRSTLEARGLSPTVLLTASLFAEDLPTLLPVVVTQQLSKLPEAELVREAWGTIEARKEYNNAGAQATALKHWIADYKARTARNGSTASSGASVPADTAFDRDNAAQGAVDGFMDAQRIPASEQNFERQLLQEANADDANAERLIRQAEEEPDADPFEGDLLPPTVPEDAIEILTDALAMCRAGEPLQETAELINMIGFFNDFSVYLDECLAYRNGKDGTWGMLTTHQQNVLTSRDPQTEIGRFTKNQVNRMAFQKACALYETFIANRAAAQTA